MLTAQIILENLFLSIKDIYPMFILMIILLAFFLVTWLISLALKFLLVKTLEMIGFDKLMNLIGFSNMLITGEVTLAPSELIGAALYWIIIFSSVLTALNFIGVDVKNNILSLMASYVPSVLGAAVLLAAAVLIAGFIFGLINFIFRNLGLKNSRTIAKIIQYAIVIFSFVAALNQLGLKAEWIITSINVVVGAVGLAFAIAFGLGCKDIAGDFLSNLFKGR